MANFTVQNIYLLNKWLDATLGSLGKGEGDQETNYCYKDLKHLLTMFVKTVGGASHIDIYYEKRCDVSQNPLPHPHEKRHAYLSIFS